MSSETINSTTAPATEPTFTIEGKDYKKSELSTKTYNSIIVRQDLQATKIKLSLELEKIAILQAHYDNAIANELGIEIKKLSKDLGKEFYDGNPQDLIEDVLDLNRNEMKSKNWDFGQDDEELLEYSLHKTQYLDFKSGDAKKKIAEDIKLKKQSKIVSKDEPSKKMTKILKVNEVSYEVDYILDTAKKESISDKKIVKGQKIISPIEGRVFFTKDPDENPVKVGDKINKGDVICYIESMKVINAIKSDYSGKIMQVCFNDGDDIYDDDILFIIN